ncbi:MAG TPA: GNVR domain-containing protein [Candidatus Angelobacter sp.]|nr:GNVR domain-containing protein [Candidatus Angelobacter sp.]
MEASGPAVVPAYRPPAEVVRPYAPPGSPPGATEKLALLWRERRFLWGVLWKTLVASLAVAFLLPTHYESVTKIVPGETQGGALMGRIASSAQNSAVDLGLDTASLLGLKTPGAFYVEILKSRTVQDRLIERFDLQRRYSLLGRTLPDRLYARLGSWARVPLYAARKKLKSFTDFDEDKKSGVITVTVTDYDRATAAKIANAYVEEMNRLAAELNTSDAHRERVFLEERLKSAKQDLDQASLALGQFSSKNSVMNPESQGRTMVDSAARVQGELIVAETDLRGLRELYSDDNIRVRTAKARIVALEGQLKKLMGGAGASPAEGRAGAYPSMRALPLLESQYADLYRQTKIQESVYEFLTRQLEMAKIQEAKELPTVRQLDKAVQEEKKSGPSRSLIVGLSLACALALGCFWVLGKHTWEQLPVNHPKRLLAGEISSDVRNFFGKTLKQDR